MFKYLSMKFSLNVQMYIKIYVVFDIHYVSNNIVY